MMNKILQGLIIFGLIFVQITSAEHSKGIWDGQEYQTKVAPPDEILDQVKEKIISLGISENYFDEHFEISYASISRGGPDRWYGIETRWNYKVNEYIVEYFVGVSQNEQREISFSTPTESLHGIKDTIPEREAKEKLKQCLPDYPYTRVILIKNGDLVLSTDGIKNGVTYSANVNLESGELSCEPIIGTIDVDDRYITQDTLSILFPDRITIDKDNLKALIDELDASYVVVKDFQPTDPSKLPPMPSIIAVIYAINPDIVVYIGWQEDWIIFQRANILDYRDRVVSELDHLSMLHVIEGYSTDDSTKIDKTLSEAEEWDFGIALVYAGTEWKQIFPKTVSSSLIAIENTKLYKLSLSEILPSGGELPITNISCDSCNPCAEGLECISFPGIGSRCAQSNPCSYYPCPPNTECNVLRTAMAQVCPDGRNVGVVPRVNCQCVGPDCPVADGETGISYDAKTGKVEIIKGAKKVSTEITIRTAPGYKGILETPIVSAKFSKELVIEESKLLMRTSAGRKTINILPEDAVAVSATPKIEMVKAIELGEESQKPVYSVVGTKQARIFFIIPVSMEVTTKINAETGNVISVNKPWWSFLAR